MTTKTQDEFKIGDTIEIIDDSCIYCAWREMAKEMKAEYWRHDYGAECCNGYVGEIMCLKEHPDGYGMLVLFRLTENNRHKEFIISIRGIKKI